MFKHICYNIYYLRDKTNRQSHTKQRMQPNFTTLHCLYTTMQRETISFCTHHKHTHISKKMRSRSENDPTPSKKSVRGSRLETPGCSQIPHGCTHIEIILNNILQIRINIILLSGQKGYKVYEKRNKGMVRG